MRIWALPMENQQKNIQKLFLLWGTRQQFFYSYHIFDTISYFKQYLWMIGWFVESCIFSSIFLVVIKKNCSFTHSPSPILFKCLDCIRKLGEDNCQKQSQLFLHCQTKVANAHTLHTSSSSPTVPGAILTTSAWLKWPNRLCHFSALSSFTLLELILNSKTVQDY